MFVRAIKIAIVTICLLAAGRYVGMKILASDFSSSSFTVTNPVITEGSASASSGNFGLGQSLGQIAPGLSTSTNFQLWSGFQYYFGVNANVVTATAGNGQVSLSWTVPQSFLGVSAGD